MGIFSIFVIIISVLVIASCKSTEWKSNNRITPPGYEHDWSGEMCDRTLHGENYAQKKNLAGGYDKPIKKD